MGTVVVKIRVSEGVWKIMRAWARIFSTDGCFLHSVDLCKMRRGPTNSGDASSVEPRAWKVNDGFLYMKAIGMSPQSIVTQNPPGPPQNDPRRGWVPPGPWAILGVADSSEGFSCVLTWTASPRVDRTGPFRKWV